MPGPFPKGTYAAARHDLGAAASAFCQAVLQSFRGSRLGRWLLGDEDGRGSDPFVSAVLTDHYEDMEDPEYRRAFLADFYGAHDTSSELETQPGSWVYPRELAELMADEYQIVGPGPHICKAEGCDTWIPCRKHQES